MTTADAVADRRDRTLYSQVLELVQEEGLFARRGGYYSCRIVMALLILTACGGAIWWLPAVPAWLCAAAAGIAAAQLALVGHDAGHQQICRSRKINMLIGIINLNVLNGLSLGWWVHKHVRHHAHPNDPTRDPDVIGGVLTLHKPRPGGHFRSRPMRRLVPILLVLEVLLLPSLVLRVTHLFRIVVGRVPAPAAEFVSILFNYIVWTVFIVQAPSLIRALVFLAVQQTVFGAYMTAAIAPNHKGMPAPTAREVNDFFLRQVACSRHVEGGLAVEILFGGLNFQIEHHLFPSMPAPNLRQASLIVEDFCCSRGVTYTKTGLVRSFGAVAEYASR